MVGHTCVARRRRRRGPPPPPAPTLYLMPFSMFLANPTSQVGNQMAKQDATSVVLPLGWGRPLRTQVREASHSLTNQLHRSRMGIEKAGFVVRCARPSRVIAAHPIWAFRLEVSRLPLPTCQATPSTSESTLVLRTSFFLRAQCARPCGPSTQQVGTLRWARGLLSFFV